VSTLKVSKSLGGDTTRTADSRSLKGYPMLCSIMLKNEKRQGVFFEGGKVAIAQRLAGRW